MRYIIYIYEYIIKYESKQAHCLGSRAPTPELCVNSTKLGKSLFIDSSEL